MFDYPLLEVLKAIERERSFERTALTLGVSKSYVSQCLRLLEERLGGIVVDRNTITTTQFGNKLCRHLENIQLMEHDFLTENSDYFITDYPDPVTIKVGVFDDSLASWLKGLLPTLSNNRNRYFLDLIITDPQLVKADLSEGRMHCAISTSRDPLPGFANYHLGTHSYRATASPSYISEHFPCGVTPSSISKAPLMQYGHADVRPKTWMKIAFGQNLVSPIHVIPSAQGILKNCLDGKVWAMNSSLLANTHIDDGCLVEIIPELSLQTELHWHVNKFISRTLQELTDAIKLAAHSNMNDLGAKLPSSRAAE